MTGEVEYRDWKASLGFNRANPDLSCTVRVDSGVINVQTEAEALLIAAAPDLKAALIAAKQQMWLAARDQWTMRDFKNWAVIQQIDAALTKATGVER